jgi:small-conductance mechanosensitive channel
VFPFHIAGGSDRCVGIFGIGFGLQKIACSGVILLLEGQATVGDTSELDGPGDAEIYDGKWIVVPNEDFIVTTRVTNYSDSGSANRYNVAFSVATTPISTQ